MGLGLVAMVARRRGAITPTSVCGTHIHIGWGAPAEVMVQGAAHSSMATRDIKPRTVDRTVSPTARDAVGGDYFPRTRTSKSMVSAKDRARAIADVANGHSSSATQAVNRAVDDLVALPDGRPWTSPTCVLRSERSPAPCCEAA